MRFRASVVALLVLLLVGCAGVRQTPHTFVAHAESFRILGFPIPRDDQAAAFEHVPAAAQVTSVRSTPADWTSLLGFLGNLFGFHRTEIGGVK